MTWPNWNWESVETVAMIIGGLVLVLSYNRWVARPRASEGFKSSILMPPRKYVWFPSLRDDSKDHGFGINPASGSVMLDDVDLRGNSYGTGDDR
jgi:hypothetical protein